MSVSPSFAELGVLPELIDSLAQQDIHRPTPVQVAVLQAARPDGDLIVQARTGSGKTLAFGLGFLGRLDVALALPQALVITPTRELAAQVCQALRPLAQALGLRIETLTGGADMVAQLRGLRAGAQLLIGTPGRVVDHVQRGSLKTEHLQTIVLDEGDQMLDLGFKDELEAILHALPDGRRTLLFSATMPDEMRAIAKRYMQNAETITVEGVDVQHADIEHVAVRIPRANKIEALVNVLRLTTRDRTMLFCRTKADTEEICRRLTAEGFTAGFLHGDLDQRERNRVLAAFRHGRLHLLVATEVAARGIDVPGVSHVINVDLPFNFEAYVHRSGRTGRAGRKGLCYSLVTPAEARYFRRIMSAGRIQVTWRDVPTPAEIRQAGLDRLKLSLSEQLRTTEPDHDALSLAMSLMAGQDPLEVLAKLLAGQLADDGMTGHDIEQALEQDWAYERQRSERTNDRKAGVRRANDDKSYDQEFARFRVGLGHRDHLHPGKLVGMLCDFGGITGKQIGAIRIGHDHTFFEVSVDAAKGFLQQVAAAPPKARLRVEPVLDSRSPMPSNTSPKRGFHGIKRHQKRF